MLILTSAVGAPQLPKDLFRRSLHSRWQKGRAESAHDDPNSGDARHQLL
jgi:hypothetical protein